MRHEMRSRNDGRLTIVTAACFKNEIRSKEKVIRNDTKQESRCVELKDKRKQTGKSFALKAAFTHIDGRSQ